MSTRAPAPDLIRDAPSPHAMRRAGLCIGCGSCVAQARGHGARMGFDHDGLLRPQGDPDWLGAPSPAVALTCPFSPLAEDEDALAAELFPMAPSRDSATGRYVGAWVGHVAEGDFRLRGSSGGLVSWVATELLRQGVVDGVAHVVANDDPGRDGSYFRYRISRSEAEVREGARSRYYPVEMSQVLAAIRDAPGRYAVVGIPCFIKAVQLLRREDPLFRKRIAFTLGLFCGHMKSARFVESLAWQMGVDPAQVRRVEFRHKHPARPANWYHANLELHDGRVVGRDWWHLADGDWGAGFFMDAACNACDDVMAETADVAFGDAWVEPHASDWQGTNVVVVRAPRIAQMLDEAREAGRLSLQPVDGDFVARTQAAGLRQRREGLSWRLARGAVAGPVQPRKRVAPGSVRLALRRRLIYRARRGISAWSHRMAALAHRTGRPGLYLGWARLAAWYYHALAYHRGWLGRLVRLLGLR